MSSQKTTRTTTSFLDPPGEPLKGFRPPTNYEIVKLRSFIQSGEMIKDDRTVIVKMIPQIYAIWKKVHPAIPLRSERSVKKKVGPYV